MLRSSCILQKNEIKFLVYPSISVSNWFTVWFAYGWRAEFVRFAPTESISSIKITAGAFSFAASKKIIIINNNNKL